MRPTSVEPVNDSLRSRGSAISGPVVSLGGGRGDQVEHAGRQPDLLEDLASTSIDSGVCWAGLTTIVQPAAIAGPILRVPIASGKFHGVISRHGPTGCCIVSSRPWPFGATA